MYSAKAEYADRACDTMRAGLGEMIQNQSGLAISIITSLRRNGGNVHGGL
jgi:hypothetical protein